MAASFQSSITSLYRIKQEAIKNALTEQHKRLRTQAAVEREEAVAAALRVAKEKSAANAACQVEATRKECHEIAVENQAKQQKLHLAEIKRLNER